MIKETKHIDTHSTRAAKARFARAVGKRGAAMSRYLGYCAVVAAPGLHFVLGHANFSYFIASAGIACLMLAIWYDRELRSLPLDSTSLTGRLTTDALGWLSKNTPQTPRNLWQAYLKHRQLNFLANRLLLPTDTISQLLSENESDLPTVMQSAATLSGEGNLIDVRHITAALLLTSPTIVELCTRLRLEPSDIQSTLQWASRAVDRAEANKPYYGGIGRDWATGFTPRLNIFGANISQAIQSHGAHFGTLLQSPGVHALRGSLSQGANMIALVGDTGAGKTSHIYALAQSLLAESRDPKLRHKQIVGLDASTIISHSQRPGELEAIMNTILHEASHARNIILFLDNAELFFQDGHGSFDATRLLLPVAEGGGLQIICAVTPRSLQDLKTRNPSFASSLTPVVLQEPNTDTTTQILQDTALNLEHQKKSFITYQAIRETVPLSDRYIQDLAQPGRAIKLLTQALSYPDQGVITEQSIQRSIEETQGVKLANASGAESDTLLNLEDELHKRMINQSRAVSVVSSALRRARAGVTNPNRPMGSFLFLGPTGVGKTELAKALSATCFNSQEAMIRLDMSEYQKEGDVERLLSDGSGSYKSLLLSIRQQPYSVVLLDEIEKAHPNILNLLLQLLDEGQLTDTAGKSASFRDAIIIATSNAGAQTIREHIEKGEALDQFESQFVDELINSQQFKPELLNRFDEIVLFRPLNQTELEQVVVLMITEVNKTLSNQHIVVQLTEQAIKKIVQLGYDPRLGARPMRRVVQRTIEDTLAKRILQKQVNPGDTVTLDESDIATN